MAHINGMYPPIVPSTYPAMLQQGENIDSVNYYKIYFSIPALNSISNINLKYMQISIKKQSTNISVLNKTKYFSDIYLTEAFLDNYKSSNDYNYYVLIPLSELENKKLDINQLYKIQFRFCQKISSMVGPASYSGSDLSLWLENNKNRFTQWSRVGLVKVISTPYLSMNLPVSTSRVQTSLLDIYGLLYFSNSSESEKLKSYQITLKDKNKKILYESSIIYPNNNNNPNQINYSLPYQLSNSYYYYYLVIKYVTSNLYEKSVECKFYTYFSNTNINPLEQFSAFGNEEDGYIKVTIRSKGVSLYSNNSIKPSHLIIKRTSSKSKFTLWQNWKVFSYTEKFIDKQFYDTTIESGIWYKYGIQMRGTDSTGKTVVTNIRSIDNPVMCIFDNMYLTTKDKQLKIKFNPTINQLKYNVLESQQNTLGNQFPYITRNGDNYYRTFSISGIISALSEILYENNLYVQTQFTTLNEWEKPLSVEGVLDKDNLWGAPITDIDYKYNNNSSIYLEGNTENTDSVFDSIGLDPQGDNFNHETETIASNNAQMFSKKNKKMFASDSDIYNEQQSLYEEYNLNHNINKYQDFIYEKEFRKLVFDFLYAHDAKLFRSTQEGNILIRLTNLTFEPVEGTGRLVYSFSATAIQIAEDNIDNYKKYKILEEDEV